MGRRASRDLQKGRGSKRTACSAPMKWPFCRNTAGPRAAAFQFLSYFPLFILPAFLAVGSVACACKFSVQYAKDAPKRLSVLALVLQKTSHMPVLMIVYLYRQAGLLPFELTRTDLGLDLERQPHPGALYSVVYRYYSSHCFLSHPSDESTAEDQRNQSWEPNRASTTQSRVSRNISPYKTSDKRRQKPCVSGVHRRIRRRAKKRRGKNRSERETK